LDLKFLPTDFPSVLPNPTSTKDPYCNRFWAVGFCTPHPQFSSRHQLGVKAAPVLLCACLVYFLPPPPPPMVLYVRHHPHLPPIISLCSLALLNTQIHFRFREFCTMAPFGSKIRKYLEFKAENKVD
jgi:hypothetical protein